MAEKDMFAMIVERFGEPQNARRLAPDEAARYRGRVPEALITFWVEHGWGSYRDGYFWICDPVRFDPLVRTIFTGDPELRPEDISMVAYTGEGETALMWHREKYGMTAFPHSSELGVGYATDEPIDTETNIKYSQNFLAGALLYGILQDEDEDFYDMKQILGSLSDGEVYGYVPARQLGGSEDDRQRVRVPEYFDIIAQLTPYRLVEQTSPEPGYPYGRFRDVRQIGRPR
ncbi:GAD-like domain-containing protein [Methylobacterium indicum]|uniref:GAD-like domain-containing protein n=1 Tax=Methylobacterium indicum TaxID=1775910 RepID=UPI0024353C88|nr:GAD-like domain-containing protein [Methylobacterium indicum]